MEVSIHIVRGLAATLRDRGIETQRMLAEAGLSAAALDGPQRTVPMELAMRCVRAAHALTGDPALALHMGTNAPPQMLSVVGELLVRCPTIRAALVELDRYMPLIHPHSHVRVHEGRELAHLVYEAPHEDRFGVELTFALILRIGRHFVSKQATPLEVRVRHARPGYAHVYDEIFGCPTRFGAERNEIVFSRDWLDQQQPFTDDVLVRLLKSRAEVMLLEGGAPLALHERVRAFLRAEPDLSDVSPLRVARRLGLSPRNLRKRLSLEGHSLTALVDEVRRELSTDALRDPERPIKQIAERVGFSEASAFHRAFKRWTGVTPARFRAQHTLARAS